MSLDLRQLQNLIRDGARAAFAEASRVAAGARLYAFALYTDDGLMTVMPAANTEEGFEQTARGYGFTDEFERAQVRWSPAEWKHEAVGAAHLQPVYALLNSPERDFARLRTGLVEAMTGALRELRAEGCFGADVTVFVSVSDSEHALEVEDASARALNAPEVAARFLGRFADPQ